MRGRGSEGGARRYEALGRVMAALTSEPELLQACRDLTWWRGTDHSWHIEWTDGPYASELAVLLTERIRVPGFVGRLAGPAGPATQSSASLDVMGVRFVLRALDPLGRDRGRVRTGPWRIRDALDTRRRTPSPQPWEKLLGG
ncbi:hypothetical protein [Rhizohabitans arisaemae]|uniref:hypothetical protein n=1 Tax=Rhizohabitans arisaemae TaxID=2720610 RepID=UPI0024B1918C|nr:hypothetical protein [Rhizohabitans arisaemae]